MQSQYHYINQRDLDLSKLNNLELSSFFTEMRKFDFIENNKAYANFINVQQHTFTQERINDIDSWTWRQIINKYPQLSMWCNIDKLDISDISNIFMNHKDSLITSKYSKNSITFFKDFKIFKIELKETKDHFNVKFIPYFQYFDYDEVVTSLQSGFSFDLSGENKLDFSLNKLLIKKPKDQILITFNNIIKNNLFNFKKMV